MIGHRRTSVPFSTLVCIGGAIESRGCFIVHPPRSRTSLSFSTFPVFVVLNPMRPLLHLLGEVRF